MCYLLKVWKKQVRTSTLGRIMRQFWKIYHRTKRLLVLGHREERLFFLKRIIKKNYQNALFLQRCDFMVLKKMVFSFNFVDDEKYLETLLIWREREMKKYIEENPRLLIKGYRHKKVPGYKRPIRV